MLVRLALETDEDACVDLARMQTVETLPHIPFDEPTARRTFDSYLKSASPTILVCEANDRKIAGFLVAYMTPYAFATGHFCNQEVIYVRPEYRGTRAAARLIRSFNEWADRTNPREVFAGVANGIKVERTTRFLELFGFAPVGASLRRILHGQGR